jgi:large-conductance mechanosensitive channel
MSEQLNDFNTFLFERGILGIMMGTIGGFAVTNLVKDLKTLLLIPLLKKTKIGILKSTIFSSLIEFMTIMLFIYGLYHLLIYPWFKTQIEEDKKEQERSKEWREEVLNEIKDIDMGTVYV